MSLGCGKQLEFSHSPLICSGGCEQAFCSIYIWVLHKSCSQPDFGPSLSGNSDTKFLQGNHGRCEEGGKCLHLSCFSLVRRVIQSREGMGLPSQVHFLHGLACFSLIPVTDSDHSQLWPGWLFHWYVWLVTLKLDKFHPLYWEYLEALKQCISDSNHTSTWRTLHGTAHRCHSKLLFSLSM